jgi:hypothetical protein
MYRIKAYYKKDFVMAKPHFKKKYKAIDKRYSVNGIVINQQL